VSSRHIKRILDMPDSSRVGRLAGTQQDVESARVILQTMVRQVLRGQPDDASLFPDIDGIGCPAIGVRPPCFHFDKNQHTVPLDDQIEFTVHGTNIPVSDAVSLPAEILFGRRFGSPAK
jgi:hypothetical protein